MDSDAASSAGSVATATPSQGSAKGKESFDVTKYVKTLTGEQLWGPTTAFTNFEARMPGLQGSEIWEVCEVVYFESADHTSHIVDSNGSA